MTVGVVTRKAGPSNGNGVTTAFPFDFKVFVETDVKVILTDSSGVETVQTITTDYTVSMNADQDTNPGGTVNMVTAPITGDTLTLESQVPQSQSDVFTNNGGWYPSVINDALDRLTILIQDQQVDIDRKIGIASTDSMTSLDLPVLDARKGMVLGFNSSTGEMEGVQVSGSSIVSKDFCTASGSANSLVLATSIGNVITGTQQGPSGWFIASFTNTGAVDVTRDGVSLGAAQWNGAAMVGGELQSGKAYSFYQDTLSTVQIKAIGSDIFADSRTGSVATDVATMFKSIFVDSIADLKSVAKGTAFRIFTFGYYSVGDKGAAQYWYDPSDTSSPDDGFSVIVATDGGRYKLVIEGRTNLRQAGAKGDMVQSTAGDGTVSSGTPDFTSASGAFTADDVGKTICIGGAGAAGVDLVTTIKTFVSTTAVTLNANASTSVTTANYGYGTDDSTARDTVITWAEPLLAEVLVPNGDYLVTTGATISSDHEHMRFVGESRNGTNWWAVNFSGTTPVFDFVNTSGNGLGCGGVSDCNIERYDPTGSSPHVGAGIRFNGIDGGVFNNVRIKKFSYGAWFYNNNGGLTFTENNALYNFYIANCNTHYRFENQTGGSALTSFSGTRLRNCIAEAYDGEIVLQLVSYAYLYNAELDIKSWSVTGTVSLFTATATSKFEDSVWNLHHEVLSGASTPTFDPSTGTISNVRGRYFDHGNRASVPDANLNQIWLDDEIEGTWTPTIQGSTTAGTTTYTVQGGWYKRKGSSVRVYGKIAITNQTGTGDLQIGGLPFTSRVTGSLQWQASCPETDNLALTAANVPFLSLAANSKILDIKQAPSGGGATAAVPIDTNFSIYFNFEYDTGY